MLKSTIIFCFFRPILVINCLPTVCSDITPCHAEYFMFTLLLSFDPVNLQNSSCRHDVFSIKVKNSVDPDWTASLEAS